jgi:hypothetical protein
MVAVHLWLHVGLGALGLRPALLLAGLLWLGFVAAPLVVNQVIGAGHWLPVLLAQGAVNGLLAADGHPPL